MFGITLSDLVYRRRQFLIATAGAGLVFAMTLLLAGLAAGFGVEINQSVSGFHSDAWVVKANTPTGLPRWPPPRAHRPASRRAPGSDPCDAGDHRSPDRAGQRERSTRST